MGRLVRAEPLFCGKALQNLPLIRPCGPPSPLGGEGFTDTVYRLPPSGGKLSSQARLMREQMIEPRADEDIRPYGDAANE